MREEGGKERDIIMVGGCQGEREERSRGRERKRSARRESPAHSAKTIQLVSEGAHSPQRERQRQRGKGERGTPFFWDNLVKHTHTHTLCSAFTPGTRILLHHTFSFSDFSSPIHHI